MDLSTEEIANKYGLAAVWPAVDAALKEYGAQEAKSYASWIANQPIMGRTYHKLWLDYEAEVLSQVPPAPAQLMPRPSLTGTPATLPSFSKEGDAAAKVAGMFPHAPALSDNALARMLDNHCKAVDEWYGTGDNNRSREATTAEIERGALLAEVARLRAAPAPVLSLVEEAGPQGWISVEERLPDAVEPVLALSVIPGDSRVYIARWMPHASPARWWLRDSPEQLAVVTHWMPLPTTLI